MTLPLELTPEELADRALEREQAGKQAGEPDEEDYDARLRALASRHGLTVTSAQRSRMKQARVNPRSPNSYHTSGDWRQAGALDVAGDPGKMRAFFGEVRQAYPDLAESFLHLGDEWEAYKAGQKLPRNPEAGRNPHVHLAWDRRKQARQATPAQPPQPSTPTASPEELADQRLAAPQPPAFSQPSPYDDLIREKAAKHGVPAEILRAVVRAESNFNPNARSTKGAMGLGQLMRDTARQYGVKNAFDPGQNLEGAARYLKDLKEQFGRWDLTLAAYNAGPGNVQEHGGVPPFQETRGYIRKIYGDPDVQGYFDRIATGARVQTDSRGKRVETEDLSGLTPEELADRALARLSRATPAPSPQAPVPAQAPRPAESAVPAPAPGSPEELADQALQRDAEALRQQANTAASRLLRNTIQSVLPPDPTATAAPTVDPGVDPQLVEVPGPPRPGETRVTARLLPGAVAPGARRPVGPLPADNRQAIDQLQREVFPTQPTHTSPEVAGANVVNPLDRSLQGHRPHNPVEHTANFLGDMFFPLATTRSRQIRDHFRQKVAAGEIPAVQFSPKPEIRRAQEEQARALGRLADEYAEQLRVKQDADVLRFFRAKHFPTLPPHLQSLPEVRNWLSQQGADFIPFQKALNRLEGEVRGDMARAWTRDFPAWLKSGETSKVAPRKLTDFQRTLVPAAAAGRAYRWARDHEVEDAAAADLAVNVLSEIAGAGLARVGGRAVQAVAGRAGQLAERAAGTKAGQIAAGAVARVGQAPVVQGARQVVQDAAGTKAGRIARRVLKPDEGHAQNVIAGALQQGVTYQAGDENPTAEGLVANVLTGALGGYLVGAGFRLSSFGLQHLRHAARRKGATEAAVEQALTDLAEGKVKGQSAVEPQVLEGAKQARVRPRKTAAAPEAGEAIDEGAAGAAEALPETGARPETGASPETAAPEPAAAPRPPLQPGDTVRVRARSGKPSARAQRVAEVREDGTAVLAGNGKAYPVEDLIPEGMPEGAAGPMTAAPVRPPIPEERVSDLERTIEEQIQAAQRGRVGTPEARVEQPQPTPEPAPPPARLPEPESGTAGTPAAVTRVPDLSDEELGRVYRDWIAMRDPRVGTQQSPETIRQYAQWAREALAGKSAVTPAEDFARFARVRQEGKSRGMDLSAAYRAYENGQDFPLSEKAPTPPARGGVAPEGLPDVEMVRYWLENEGGQPTTSAIQKQFKVGYTAAANLLDRVQGKPAAATPPKPGSTPPAGKPPAQPAGRTVTVEVEGEPRAVTLTPEQARQWDAAEKDYQSKLSHAQTVAKTDGERAAKMRRAAGMEFAADKRRITGQLTAKEQAAAEKAANALIPDRPVTVETGNGPKRGVVVSRPAYGKVKVRLESGAEASFPTEKVTVRRGDPTQVSPGDVRDLGATPLGGAVRDMGAQAGRQAQTNQGGKSIEEVRGKAPLKSDLGRELDDVVRGEVEKAKEQRRAAGIAPSGYPEEPPYPFGTRLRHKQDGDANQVEVFGYDSETGTVYFADPETGEQAGRSNLQRFQEEWEPVDGTPARTTDTIPVAPVRTETPTAPPAEKTAVVSRTETTDPEALSTPDLPEGYGASNQVFTRDRYEAARARLAEKLGRLTAGLDPEMVTLGVEVAGYHIEAGARKWGDYVAAMVQDLGENVRPYLRSWYEAARHYPEFDAKGMSDAAEIEAFGKAAEPAATGQLAPGSVQARTEPETPASDAAPSTYRQPAPEPEASRANLGSAIPEGAEAAAKAYVESLGTGGSWPQWQEAFVQGASGQKRQFADAEVLEKRAYKAGQKWAQEQKPEPNPVDRMLADAREKHAGLQVGDSVTWTDQKLGRSTGQIEKIHDDGVTVRLENGERRVAFTERSLRQIDPEAEARKARQAAEKNPLHDYLADLDRQYPVVGNQRKIGDREVARTIGKHLEIVSAAQAKRLSGNVTGAEWVNRRFLEGYTQIGTEKKGAVTVTVLRKPDQPGQYQQIPKDLADYARLVSERGKRPGAVPEEAPTLEALTERAFERIKALGGETTRTEDRVALAREARELTSLYRDLDRARTEAELDYSDVPELESLENAIEWRHDRLRELGREQRAKADPKPETKPEAAPRPEAKPEAAPLTQARKLAQDEPLKGKYAPGDPDAYTLEQHRALRKRIQEGDLTAAELQREFQRAVASEDAIKAELYQKTVKELAPRGARGRKKGELVDAIWNSLLEGFHVGESLTWSPFQETKTQAIRRFVEKTTDADLKAYAAKRKETVDFRKKALENPETEEELRLFVMAKGEAALTPEQRAKWDEINADRIRANRTAQQERQATIAPVEAAAGVEMTVKEGWHTKHQKKIWIVQHGQRVERSVYDELKARAKKLGGYYSSFGPKENHGFIFFSEEAAEAFRKVEETISGAERVAGREETREKSAASRLREVADRLREKAEESLGKDRLANTARRARMAEGAEAQANADLALAKTMANLADAIADGRAKHLDGISAKTHVETLDGLLRQAMVRSAHAQNLRYEVVQERGPALADIDHVQYPYPYAPKRALLSTAGILSKHNGSKQLAARLKKWADSLGDDGIARFRSAPEIDTITDAAGKLNGLGEKWEAAGITGNLDDYNRLQRMGLETPAQLRAALREYLEYRGAKAEADPVKAAERALVGQKIERIRKELGEISRELQDVSQKSRRYKFGSDNYRRAQTTGKNLNERRTALEKELDQAEIDLQRARIEDLAEGREGPYGEQPDLAQQLAARGHMRPGFDPKATEAVPEFAQVQALARAEAEKLGLTGEDAEMAATNAADRMLRQPPANRLDTTIQSEARTAVLYRVTREARKLPHLENANYHSYGYPGDRFTSADGDRMIAEAKERSQQLVEEKAEQARQHAVALERAKSEAEARTRAEEAAQVELLGRKFSPEQVEKWEKLPNNVLGPLGEAGARLRTLQEGEEPDLLVRGLTDAGTKRLQKDGLLDEQGMFLTEKGQQFVRDLLDYQEQTRLGAPFAHYRPRNEVLPTHYLNGQDGWLAPEIDGKQAYTNSHILVLAEKAPGDLIRVERQPQAQRIWDRAKDESTQPARPVAFEYPESGEMPKVYFDNGVPLDARYFDYFRKTFGEDVEFRFAAQWEKSPPPATVYRGKEMVGVIMPIQPHPQPNTLRILDPDGALSRLDQKLAQAERAVLDRLEKQRQEREKKGGKLTSGFGALSDITEDLPLYAQLGAIKLLRGTVDAAEWAQAMVRDYGPLLREHLDTLWREALRYYHGPLKEEFPDAPDLPEGLAQVRSVARLAPAESPVRTVKELETAFREHFRLSPEEASATAQIAAARAEAWARATGESPEAWLSAHVASLGTGKPGGGRSLLQEEGAATLYQSGSPTPFFSQAERAAAAFPQGKATVQQWRAHLKKAGVKDAELQWTGLDEWLEARGGQPVTKAEVEEFLRQNRVEVREVVLGGGDIARENIFPRFQAAYEERTGKPAFENYSATSDFRNSPEFAEWEKHRPAEPKYSQYKLSGGENYRELLLTLPAKNKAADAAQKALDAFNEKHPNIREASRDSSEWREYVRLTDALMDFASDSAPQYRSGHWDEPNVLAHVRFDERTDADGNRVLHVAEIQSDWHQQGRKSGYDDPLEPKRYEFAKRYYHVRYRRSLKEITADEARKLTEQIAAEAEAAGVSQADVLDAFERYGDFTQSPERGVPDAPLRKTWHEAALRRIVHWAAENGFDRVTWDVGATQADRFDLSKQVRELHYDVRTEQLYAVDHQGGVPLDGEKVPQAKLPDYVGKEAAERLLRQEPDKDGVVSLEGEDLKLDSPGQIGFYDQILPAYARKWGKKWGAEVGQTKLNQQTDAMQALDEQIPFDATEEGVVAHYLDITPAMRESLLAEGVPLFQGPKGAVQFLEDGRAVIRALKNPDVSTGVHELAHVFLPDLVRTAQRTGKTELQADVRTVEGWLGLEEGEFARLHAGATAGSLDAAARKRYTDAQEKWARGFERYLRSGEAPTEELKGVFQRMKEWLTAIYRKLAGSPLAEQVPAEVRAVYDRLLGGTGERAPGGGRSPEAVRKGAAPKPETTADAADAPTDMTTTAEAPDMPRIRPSRRQMGDSGAVSPTATGLANQVQEREVASGLLAAHPEQGVTRSALEAQERGKQQVAEAADPLGYVEDLARKIEAEGRPFSWEEGGALLEGKRRLAVKANEARAALDAAIENGETENVPALQAAYEIAQGRLQGLVEQIQRAKTEWHNTGMALQAGTELDTADFAQVIAHAQRKLGRELPEPERREFRDLTGQVEKLRKERRNLQAKIKRLQADESVKRKARVRQPKPVTRESVLKERESLFTELDEILKAVTAQLEGKGEGKAPEPAAQAEPAQAAQAPEATTLYQEAPRAGAVDYEPLAYGRIAGKLALTYVKEGLTDLDRIAGQVVRDFEARGVQVTREQVIDDLAEGAEASRRRELSEVQKQIQRLRAQARTDAKARGRIAELERQLREEDLKPKLPGVPRELSDRMWALRARERRLGREIEALIEAKQPKSVFDRLAQGANLVRGTVLGSDVGMLLRQGLFAWSRPVVAGKALVQAGKAWVSQDAMDQWELEIAERTVHGKLAQRARAEAGLQLTDTLTHPEELVVSRLFRKVPGLKHLFGDRLERFQVTFINAVRADLFDQALAAGFTPEELKLRANFINSATGRSNAAQVSKILQVLMTSPRYERSRWEMLGQPFKNAYRLGVDGVTGKGLNRAALANLQDMAVTAASIYGLFKLMEVAAGYEVEWNPESGDFLKMRRGEEVWDVSAGLAPRLRDVLRVYLMVKNPDYHRNLQRWIGQPVLRTTSPPVRLGVEQSVFEVQRRQGAEEPKSIFTGFPEDEERRGLILLAPLIYQTVWESLHKGGPGEAAWAGFREAIGQSVHRYPKRHTYPWEARGQRDPLEHELRRLKIEEIRVAPLEVDGERVKLSPAEQKEFQRWRGDALRAQLEWLVGTPAYGKLGDPAKRKELDRHREFVSREVNELYRERWARANGVKLPRQRSGGLGLRGLRGLSGVSSLRGGGPKLKLRWQPPEE